MIRKSCRDEVHEYGVGSAPSSTGERRDVKVSVAIEFEEVGRQRAADRTALDRMAMAVRIATEEEEVAEQDCPAELA